MISMQNANVNKELQKWEEYLQWRKQVSLTYYDGIKCLGARYNKTSKTWNVLVAMESKNKFLLFQRSLARTEFSVVTNATSAHRWTWSPTLNAEFGDNVGVFQNIQWKKPLSAIQISDLHLWCNAPYFSPMLSELKAKMSEAILASFTFSYKQYVPNLTIGEGFLVTPQCAEMVLIEREEKALQDFKRQSNSKSLQWILNPESVNNAYNPNADYAWKNDRLNADQKTAIRKALSNAPVCFIQGPPGTGKTTVIAEIVYQTVCQGKRVLIASQMHAAVDNVMQRLIHDPSIRGIRLGRNQERITAAAEQYMEENALPSFYRSIATCLKDKFSSSNHDIEELQRLEADLLVARTMVQETNSVNVKIQDIESQIEILKKRANEQADAFSTAYIHYINNRQSVTVLHLLKQWLYNGINTEELVFSGTELRLFYGALRPLYPSNALVEKLGQMTASTDGIKLHQTNQEFLTFINMLVSTKDAEQAKLRMLSVIDEQIALNSVQKEIYDTCYAKYLQYNLDAEKMQEDVAILKNQEKEIDNQRIAFAMKYRCDADSLIKTLSRKIREHTDEVYGDTRQFQRDWGEIATTMRRLLNDPTQVAHDKSVFNTEYINACNVVGVTCTENSRTLDAKGFRQFDLVIVDEVSKATLPELLIPILKGKRTVLVGDHRQLPPVFSIDREMSLEEEKANPEKAMALKRLLSDENKRKFSELVTTSLFEQWFKHASKNVRHRLNFQYRMHGDICLLINRFYEFQLKDGLTHADEMKQKHHGVTINQHHGHPMITPQQHAYWFNSAEDRRGEPRYSSRRQGSKSLENLYEADFVLKLLRKLESSLWHPTSTAPPVTVGVISFYKDQAKAIAQSVNRSDYKAIDLEIDTVDAFQGKEKNIIIVSMVTNSPQQSASGFMREFERINVAFSRAQNLLIVVGAANLFIDQNVYLPYMDVDGGEEQYVYKNMIQKLKGQSAYFECADLLGY